MELRQLGALAQKLSRAINSSRAGKEVARTLVRSLLADRHFKLREPASNFQSKWARERFLSELPEVGVSETLVASISEFTEWDEAPEAARLAFWTKELNELSVLDLLEQFRRQLARAEKLAPRISQPRRKDRGLKRLLILEVSRFMQEFFEQPLDEYTARIVSALLDLRDGRLDRHYVRSYRKKC